MPIYLDNAATTPVCPQAAQAAFEVMTEGYGNPSSGYELGRQAARRLEADRAAVAQRLGCGPEELAFVSCGTEGDNWSVLAAAERGKRLGKHIVATAIEHAAVLEPLRALAGQGCEVTYLRPDRQGHIDPADLAAALRPDTVLVSMMLVNNEVGTIQPVAEAARAIKAAGSPALLHTDAVQAFLKIPFTPQGLWGVDLLTISGHKIRAPKGVGALYVRKGLRFPPLMLGGGQEEGMRPGTEATAQTAAFAAACAVGKAEMNSYTVRMNPNQRIILSNRKGQIIQRLIAVPGLIISIAMLLNTDIDIHRLYGLLNDLHSLRQNFLQTQASGYQIVIFSYFFRLLFLLTYKKDSQ